ncbi:ATP-binding cassette domain-containing protein, partial [Streptosporangium carneum]
AAELLDRFDLAEAAGEPVATYSGGMRRRLDLATALVGEPRIVFLDEPATGLDPRGHRAMRQIVRDLANDGVTIFLTAQSVRETEGLADRIAVLDRGKLVAEGTPDDLRRLVPGHVRLRFTDPDALEWAARAFGETPRDDDALTLRVPNDGSVSSLRALLRRIDHELLAVDEVSVHAPDLDDVFLTLTGRSAP